MRETFAVLVSGRGALATLAGVPSVERHVQAGKTLGLDVIVVYPPERRALGAEIRGIIAADAACVPADQFTELLASRRGDDGGVMLVASEWYLSLAAIAAMRDFPAPRVFGRVCERGCVSVPIARVTRDEAAGVALQLGSTSAAAALATLYDDLAPSLDLDTRSEQRLSDNVSVAHAEEKLVETLFGPRRVLPVLRLRPRVAPLLARWFSATALGPAGISAIKLLVGLAAAWIIEGGSYGAGLLGALLYFVARVIGASGIVLARASLADSDIREKLDVAGDTVLHIALLWSLAGGPARGSGGVVLAAIATAGVLVSTGIAYVFVLRGHWEARRHPAGLAAESKHGPAIAHVAPVADGARGAWPTASDEFLSRFVQRDGIAYAMLFAAAAGRLDLFLWAAALASHLFYVLWLLARPRREDGPMAYGKPA